MSWKIIRIQESPQWKDQAAQWFHQKWGIPLEAYQQSMEECQHPVAGQFVPQWYLAVEGKQIIGGLGVIENDFHDRKDLTPNVCALYVEESHRCQGIAGELLGFVCREFADRGIPALYLLTDHNSFYERYGWEFLCMVQGEGETEPSRMYRYSPSIK
jgi:GNAT superfamily N-acetyltransferase